ncbi:restriction endonuclease subunit S [Pseudidiomarina sp. 1APR75-33.1]|uniref:restriction endonuclease subunit S n=1 Tax=Pseudidiomarina terrestris TaxID=2820060 RepID=UPI00264D96BA|nr:restriction endonuclease subunit S [Pseudidiomarina sp. 1APR75-33.1]MDN7126470.1 restriction endonuclease subunit S [Pseudidiomarina sp. 1APR75-33.1]
MRYESYKPIFGMGADWLIKLPEHWELLPSKALFQDRNVRAGHEEEQLTASQKYGVIPQSLFSKLEDHRVMQVVTGRDILKQARNGDFVISMRSFQGGLEYCQYDGAVSSAYVPIFERNRKIASGYFKYLFKERAFIKALQQTSNLVRDGQALRFSNFTQLKLPYPPFNEQQKIAQLLDYETAKIDALIDEQKRLIELLKEKRQAVISHAVTKGLNPDAPMKDSGVEWLEEVPEHWSVVPLKHIAQLNPSKSEYMGPKSAHCTFIPMEKLKTNSLELDESRVISDVYSGYTYFRDGDVLFAKVTPCFENRNTAIADNLINSIGFGSSEINVFRPGAVTSKFLYYRLLEDVLVNYWTSEMTGAGGLKRVPSTVIENYLIALPSASEQRNITSYLDDRIQKMDELSSEAKNNVEFLKERRSALISAAVTGKIDVRDWQPPAGSDTVDSNASVQTERHYG